MSQIAAQVGGSKSTIYGYYKNKEELFLEVVLNGIQRMVENASSELDSSLLLFDKLHILGVEYLSYILSEDTIALRRMLHATSNQGEAVRTAYYQVLHSSWEHVADLIASAMKEGLLREGDPWIAATQLKCLFELDLVDRRLLNINQSTSAEEIEQTVVSGLDIFRCYYKPLNLKS